MPLTLYIYKNSLGDATNGGVSSKVDKLTLMNVEGPAVSSEGAPEAYLRPSRAKGYPPHIVISGSKETTMAGGNYAGTSDSRLSRAVESMCGTPVNILAIHDRIE